jgi:DedD protein
VEDRLKQRLIGATVLVALAVIFLPMLLDTKSDEALQPLPLPLIEHEPLPLARPFDALPPGAAAEVIPVAEPATGTIARREPPAPLAPEPEPVAAPVPSPPPREPDLMSPGPVAQTLSAWVVQVGSFSKEENAVALRDRLQVLGHSAFVERVQQGGSDIFRVRVGPEVDRGAAESLRDRVEKEVNLKGLVTQYP